MEKILTTNMHSAWRERCLKVSQLKQRDIPASKAFLWPLYPKEEITYGLLGRLLDPNCLLARKRLHVVVSKHVKIL